MFLAYLIYFYKLNMLVCSAQVYNRDLFKVAIAMGATIDLAYFLWMIRDIFGSDNIPEQLDIGNIMALALMFIQQVVIIASLTCTKKMAELCEALIFKR